MYLAHRRRIAVGLEHLRLNGIFVNHEYATHSGCGNQILADLAGNAFESKSFSAVFLCMLTVVSATWSHRHDVLAARTVDEIGVDQRLALLMDDSSDSDSSSSDSI